MNKRCRSGSSLVRATSVVVVVMCAACGVETPGERQAHGAGGTHAGSSPSTTPAAGGGGTGALPPLVTDSDLDGGVAPIRDSCADGGCKEPETRKPDDDGFSVAEGDCDDFAPLTNPGAYDVPGNGIDEDCDGLDAKSDACDEMLEISDTDPIQAAKAIELCQVSPEGSRRWGSTRWRSSTT